MKKFFKNNYLWLILVVYGVFLMFYKWSGGSFMGDEATYSQVAKESLYDHSYFILHWKGDLWLEKPPLVIWLTILAFQIFGISETSAHIFPGLFSIFSAIILYFFGKNIFKSKMAGFLAGFIFLTSPIIALYARVNMMDIPVGVFVALAFLSIWKIWKGKEKWWLALGAALGLGIMTKSVVGLLPLGLFIMVYVFWRKNITFPNKYLGWGIVIFLVIILPWHLFMTLEFGGAFWQDYFGFHIWDRFFHKILLYPWEGNSLWGYIKLFWFRSGIWFFLFIANSVLLVVGCIGRYKNKRYFTKLLENKRAWIFLYLWLALVTLPFFVSVTKLPNYMVLAYYPLALIVGGFFEYFWRQSRIGFLWAVSILSLFNFLPVARLFVSDFGEAHLFLPKFFIRYLGPGDEVLIFFMVILMILVSLIFLKFYRQSKVIKIVFLLVFFSMNAIIHFAPMRSEFIKKIALDLTRVAKNNPLKLYVIMKPDHFSFHCVGAFYLPLKSRVENLEKRKMDILPANEDRNLSFCYVDQGLENEEMREKKILSYKEGIVINCKVGD